MRIITNGPLLRRRSRISGFFLLAASVCLVGGFVYSFFLSDLLMQYAVTLATLIVGLILWSRNQAYLQKWGPRWRQDGPLRQGLRSLDDRHYLLVAPAADLPDYLLVGPMGIAVLVPSAVRGTVSWAGRDWRHSDARPAVLRWLLFFLAPSPSLGNPSAEAQQGVEATRAYLERNGAANDLLARVSIEPIVVFTDPNVKLSVQGSPVTAMLLRSLRGHLRRPGPRGLSAREVEQLVETLTTSAT